MISKELGLTRDQVLGRSRRLRIAGVADFAREAEPFPAPGNERKVRLKSRPAAELPGSDETAGLPLWDRVPPDRVGVHKSLSDVGAGECRWVDADGTYCAHAVHLLLSRAGSIAQRCQSVSSSATLRGVEMSASEIASLREHVFVNADPPSPTTWESMYGGVVADLARERETGAARYAEIRRLAMRCYQLRTALETAGLPVPEIEV
jgi:hypothetical protein